MYKVYHCLIKVREKAKKSLVQFGTIASLYKEYTENAQQQEELRLMMEETGSEDPEMKMMLQKDIAETQNNLLALDEKVSWILFLCLL